LKFFIAAILLIAFTAQTFNKGLLILDYYANTASFEKDCVNKDKPMMHCCGRCQLKKKLQQEENNEKSAEQRSSKNELPISSKSFFATVPVRRELAFNIQHPSLSGGAAIKMPRSIFHPPGA
jgi:hypothetical protein